MSGRGPSWTDVRFSPGASLTIPDRPSLLVLLELLLLASPRLARPALAALAALAIIVCSPAAGNAAVLDGCPDQHLERPFLPWLDPASYVLVPNGGVERGASGWTLDGGARVVDGNESFNVGGDDDDHSLALPSGAAATSPSLCIGVEHPTVRLFARNTGSPTSTLAVAVVFRDLEGEPRSLPVGLVTAGADWQPTVPLPLLANLLAVLPAGQQAAIRLTPADDGGEWTVDDVYIDPYSKG